MTPTNLMLAGMLLLTGGLVLVPGASAQNDTDAIDEDEDPFADDAPLFEEDEDPFAEYEQRADVPTSDDDTTASSTDEEAGDAEQNGSPAWGLVATFGGLAAAALAGRDRA